MKNNFLEHILRMQTYELILLYQQEAARHTREYPSSENTCIFEKQHVFMSAGRVEDVEQGCC